MNFASPDGNSGWITGLTYTFTGLTPGQTYYYHVKARKDVPGTTGSELEREALIGPSKPTTPSS